MRGRTRAIHCTIRGLDIHGYYNGEYEYGSGPLDDDHDDCE